MFAAAKKLWGEQGEMTWLVRLGLLTGARLEELCQMARANVGEIEGVLSLTIDTGRFEEDGKPYRRKIKNDASERIVPVHSALIAAGFVNFAEAGADCSGEFSLEGRDQHHDDGLAYGHGIHAISDRLHDLT